MKDNVPVQNRDRTPGDGVSREDDTGFCPIAGVRRPSGRIVILGLLVGVLALQGGLLVGLHGHDWATQSEELDPSIWDTLRFSQPDATPSSRVVPTHQLPAFYPPPNWDNGILSPQAEGRSDDSTSLAYATPTFSALLAFLKEQVPSCTDRTLVAIPQQRPPSQTDFLGPFRQASTSAP